MLLIVNVLNLLIVLIEKEKKVPPEDREFFRDQMLEHKIIISWIFVIKLGIIYLKEELLKKTPRSILSCTYSFL